MTTPPPPTKEQLLRRRDELRERLNAIKRDYGRGLDKDFEEQAIELENAEVLAGICITQLVKPGLPVCYGGICHAFDMRTTQMIFCGPELPDHYRQHIKQQAKKCRNVLLQDFTDDLMSYMNFPTS